MTANCQVARWPFNSQFDIRKQNLPCRKSGKASFIFAVFPSARSPSLHPGTSSRCPRGKKQEPARRPVHQLNSISGGDIEGAPKGIRIPVAALKGRCPSPLDDGGLNATIVAEMGVPVKSRDEDQRRTVHSKATTPQCSPVSGTKSTLVTLRLVTSCPVLVTSHSV